MGRKLNKTIRKWLRYELRDDDRAERELGRVFSQLPRELPSPGFAERVMLAGGWTTVPQQTSGRALKWAFGVGLVAAVLARIWVPGILIGVARSGKLADLATESLVALTHQVAELLTAWQGVWTVGESLSTAVDSPLVMIGCALAAVLSIGAFHALSELLLSDRSTSYAKPV